MIYPNKAVKAIILRESKILIVKNKTKLWDLPGGLVEKKEKKKDALKREVFEETSLLVNIKDKAGYWEFIRSYDNEKIHVTTYFCEIDRDSNELNISKEHTEYLWIHPLDITHFKVKSESLINLINNIFGKKKTDENTVYN